MFVIIMILSSIFSAIFPSIISTTMHIIVQKFSIIISSISPSIYSLKNLYLILLALLFCYQTNLHCKNFYCSNYTIPYRASYPPNKTHHNQSHQSLYVKINRYIFLFHIHAKGHFSSHPCRWLHQNVHKHQIH